MVFSGPWIRRREKGGPLTWRVGSSIPGMQQLRQSKIHAQGCVDGILGSTQPARASTRCGGISTARCTQLSRVLTQPNSPPVNGAFTPVRQQLPKSCTSFIRVSHGLSVVHQLRAEGVLTKIDSLPPLRRFLSCGSWRGDSVFQPMSCTCSSARLRLSNVAAAYVRVDAHAPRVS